MSKENNNKRKGRGHAPGLSALRTRTDELEKANKRLLNEVSERKRVEEELRRSEKKLRDITSSLGEGVLVLDRGGRLVFINPEAERLLGWNGGELMGKELHGIIHCRKADGTSLPVEECPAFKVLETGERIFSDDEVFRRKDASEFPVAYGATPIMEGGKVVAAVVSFRDITLRKKLERELKIAATIDKLTGILNRQTFEGVLEKEIARAVRYRQKLSLIMFDVDNFKRVNDTYGHHAGDRALRAIADILKENIRKSDSFGRWGGEEFMIAAPGINKEETLALAEKIRALIERHVFESAGQITISCGISYFTKGDTLDSLARRADDALYRAKNGGRNRVESDSE